MKKLLCLVTVFLLLAPHANGEGLPEGFYEMEIVKNAIQEQIVQFRQFTPAQVEVIYLASKILHEEYFGSPESDTSTFDNFLLPQGEYMIGEIIKPGSYRFSLGDSDIAVLWVEKPGRVTHNYYSMSDTTDKTEVILRLEEGWTLRVTYSNVYISKMTGF